MSRLTIDRTACLLLLTIAGSASVGCNESMTGENVSGAVTYRGAPVTTGAVMFYPQEGRPVSASLSDTGEYSCRLLPGEYLVTITVGVKLPPGWREGDPVPPPAFKLPPQYTTRARSTLTALVKDPQTEPIDFVLD